MKIKTNDTGERPAGSEGSCMYCGVSAGGPHSKGCVIPKRTVVLEATVEVVWSVPESWTREEIEFHLNEGSFCADNVWAGLKGLEDPCSCEASVFRVAREATQDDHDRLLWANQSDASGRDGK